ncbi:HAD-IA family hydrolase [Actinoplanes xinjiangensis]|uniref:HAD-IA family hydrolase n=1 Tax=Actinoplanes xinjiangensis TaxID=512350 RepID=UPI0034216D34
MTRALIFDCDGVIVDLETVRHRRAFNQMWREHGVGWQWSEQQYARALAISGGRERLAALRDDPAFRAVYEVPSDPRVWAATVAGWHARKTEIYAALVRTGVTARSGVRRLAAEALAAGWQVGVASAGARTSVLAVLRCAVGPDMTAALSLVTGEDVSAKKPAPEVYELAARRMGVDPADCVVVEDTRNGMRAAVAAGMTCVITPTWLTFHDDFDAAALVVTGLGDPGGPPEVVIGGRCWPGARPYLSLDDLAALTGAGSGFRLPQAVGR